eukprot:18866-Prorocentrum_minimum.AAC.3
MAKRCQSGAESERNMVGTTAGKSPCREHEQSALGRVGSGGGGALCTSRVNERGSGSGSWSCYRLSSRTCPSLDC